MRAHTDKVVCITNASDIGLQLAQKFAQDGARIVISAPDADGLERAHHELTSRGVDGVDVLAYPCDASEPSSVRELLRMAVRWFGRVDVLVNVWPGGPAGRDVIDVLEKPVLTA